MTTIPTPPLDCAQARDALLDDQHGRLDRETQAALQLHLQSCDRCARLEQQERRLNELLRTRLERPVAPPALRARLAAQLSATTSTNLTARRARDWLSGGLAAVLLMAAAAVIWLVPRAAEIGAPQVLREAVNDHLRVVYAAQPIEIESGGIHQVKPWFTGRLDFAPDIAFSGDADFPLLGGAIGYFIDRKAATLVFKRRLHTISCFVVRAQNLPWPRGERQTLAGGQRVELLEVDGFHVLLWRSADLGHALVSDAGPNELLQLATKIVQAR